MSNLNEICSSEIGTCIIMTMGDKAAHKNEKYKFLVGSRQTKFYDLIWFDLIFGV